MKAILLLICIAVIFASAKVIVNKRLARTVAPEDPSLQIEFQGTCAEFRDRVLQSVSISALRPCLPLVLQPGYPTNPDYDDLHAHYFCTDKSKDRSIHHFVEIFSRTVNEDHGPVPDFVLALNPTAPFRVLSPGTTLSRRPDCKITEDYCSSTNPIVSSCTTNNVATKKGWALNNDRIYITAHAKVTNDCKDNTVCCDYVAPSIHNGICPHHANEELLQFHEHKHDHDDHHDKHDHDDHRPQHHNDHDDNKDDGYGRKKPENNGYGKKDDDRKGDDRKDGYGKKGDDRKDGYGKKDGEREGKPGKPQQHKKEEDDDEE